MELLLWALVWLALWFVVGLFAAMLFCRMVARAERDMVRALERKSVFCRRQAD